MLTDEDRKDVRKIIRDDMRHMIQLVWETIEEGNYSPEVKTFGLALRQELMAKLPEYIRKAEDLKGAE